MTELQWLISMLTKQKLPSQLKDLFIERIGEVESSLSRPLAQRPPLANPSAQAPSMQRIIDEAPMPIAPRAIPTLPAKIDKETGRAVVQTGNGTFGPRKF